MALVDYSTGEFTGQELSDKSPRGKERPWIQHKRKSMKLSEAFYELGEPDRAGRIALCAEYLTYRINADGTKKLSDARFCRERLCAMCQWRRSLRTHRDVTRIVDYLGAGYRYIFLTLTVRNCKPDKLSQTIDELGAAWKRFADYAVIKKAFKGTFRSIEVKHNLKTNEYHPHMHVMIAVKPSYFRSKHYISNKPVEIIGSDGAVMRENSPLVKLWLKATRREEIDEHIICDLRRVRGTMSKAVAEVAKYTVKPDDMIIPWDWQFTLDTVRTLHSALSGRRLIAYGGVMKEAKHALGIKDEEEADLVHTDDDKEDVAEGAERTYYWYSGYNQYFG